MIYANALADVLLPSTTGGALTEVKKNTPVALPSTYPYLTRLGLTRVSQGIVTEDIPQADPVTITVGNAFQVTAYAANAADAAVFGSQVVASTSYTMFGKISWTDDNGSWTAKFSVVGTGTNGSGATFSIESIAGAATKPVAATSSISPSTGKVTFNFDSGAPNSIESLEALYEPIIVNDASMFQDTEDRVTGAATNVKMSTYVQAGDVGTTNYATGSAGLIKTEREFPRGARIGDPCKVTNYYYRDTTYPTKITETRIEAGVVVAGDLLN